MTSPTSFSESIGLVAPRSAIQKDFIDPPLRNKLWDVVRLGFLNETGQIDLKIHPRAPVYREIWCNFFEHPSDTVPDYSSSADRTIREWFFGAEWNQVYDLLAFVFRECEPNLGKDELVQALNRFLERYLSAYRWVGNEFVPVVDDVQIQAIETGLANPLNGVRVHLSKALRMIADRESPDEENSVKESVSAVESVCSAIVGRKSTLAGALTKLKDAGVEIHPALEAGWKKIYAYTSDEDGIRHAMQDDPDLSIEDALYFLITCSAFVTLLTSKAREAGINLTPA